jgi:hypothetical protein
MKLTSALSTCEEIEVKLNAPGVNRGVLSRTDAAAKQRHHSLENVLEVSRRAEPCRPGVSMESSRLAARDLKSRAWRCCCG